MPEDVVGDILRMAFSTPYSADNSEYDSDDADEDTVVYEPEELVISLRWKRSHMFMYLTQRYQ